MQVSESLPALPSLPARPGNLSRQHFDPKRRKSLGKVQSSPKARSTVHARASSPHRATILTGQSVGLQGRIERFFANLTRQPNSSPLAVTTQLPAALETSHTVQPLGALDNTILDRTKQALEAQSPNRPVRVGQHSPSRVSHSPSLYDRPRTSSSSSRQKLGGSGALSPDLSVPSIPPSSLAREAQLTQGSDSDEVDHCHRVGRLKGVDTFVRSLCRSPGESVPVLFRLPA